jgi:hypothetical protein
MLPATAAASERENDTVRLGRLLVEVAPRTIIAEAIALLVKLGFFQKAPGPGGAFGANVYVSDGRLEAIYRRYLTSVKQGMNGEGDTGQ